jgi:transcriptional regulator GlxA family with amidase domain
VIDPLGPNHRYITKHSIEEPLLYPELISYLNLSVRQLQRLFKQYIGVNPVRYYLNVRLDRARGLVTQTDRSGSHPFD